MKYKIVHQSLVPKLISLTRKEGILRDHALTLLHNPFGTFHPFYPIRETFVAWENKNNPKKIYGWLLAFRYRHYYANRPNQSVLDPFISLQLYVGKKYRRNGIGTSLIKEADSYFKKYYPNIFRRAKKGMSRYKFCVLNDNEKFWNSIDLKKH